MVSSSPSDWTGWYPTVAWCQKFKLHHIILQQIPLSVPGILYCIFFVNTKECQANVNQDSEKSQVISDKLSNWLINYWKIYRWSCRKGFIFHGFKMTVWPRCFIQVRCLFFVRFAFLHYNNFAEHCLSPLWRSVLQRTTGTSWDVGTPPLSNVYCSIISDPPVALLALQVQKFGTYLLPWKIPVDCGSVVIVLS